MSKKQRAARPLDFAVGVDGELIPLSLQLLMLTMFLGGGKGAGKTSAMKRLFESAHAAGAQVGCIATLGRWWSLRIAKNGRGRGLKDVVVFGGKHGDVPINASSGRVVARAVVHRRIHFVLDVENMRKADRILFMADFLEELQFLKKEEDSSPPMVLFIDEAQNVAPQNATGKEFNRLKEAAADLCRECRNYRMGVILSAQRSANVHKDLLALVEALIVMRTGHFLDTAVYKKWVDEKGEDDDDYAWIRKLKRLEKGECFVYVPEARIFQRGRTKLPHTYDATKTAVIGEKIAKLGKLNKLDVKRLGTELASIVEEAKANDPAALKARVAELERQLAEKPKGYVAKATIQMKPPKVDKRAEKRAAKMLKRAEKLTAKLENVIKLAAAFAPNMALVAGTFKSAAMAMNGGAYPYPVNVDVAAREHSVNAAARGFLNAGPHPLEAHGAARHKEKLTKFGERYSAPPEQVQRVLKAKPDDGALGKGPLAVLAAVAQLNDGASRELITVMTGYKRSTRDAYVQRLVERGLVTTDSEGVLATASGRALLGPNFKPLPTGDALRQHWLAKLPEGERKILSILAEDYPRSITRENIGELSGYKLSTRNAYIHRLLTRKLVVEREDGVHASSALFGTGLP